MDQVFRVIPAKPINDYIKNNSVKLLQTIKIAYEQYFSGEASNPNSYFLRFEDQPKARIIGLAAAIRGEHPITGMKWIGSNPDNLAKGFSRASATIILNDYETKYPLACLEGSIISASRTAYSAILAADYLKKHDKHIKRLGVVGTSYIAKTVYKAFIDLGWCIDELCLYDLNSEAVDQFKAFAEGYNNVDVIKAESYDSLLIQSDMIVFTTSALTPYISQPKLFFHNPIVLHLSLRDLAPEVLLASNNIVDDIDHVLTADTSPHLLEKKTGGRFFINGNIGDLINGNVRIDNDKPSIFSPMGMGILDIALAYEIYLGLKDSESVYAIPDFF